MKNVAVVFFLLMVSVTGYSQLRGKYWWHDEWNSTHITFKRFHRFQYTELGESGKKEGAGKYKRRGRKLILNFQTNTDISDIENTVVNHTEHDAALCELKIHITDRSHKMTPLPFAEIRVYKKDSMLAAGTSDEQGNWTMGLFADGAMLGVRVKYPGLGDESFLLKAHGNYDITFVMEENGVKTKYYKKGEQLIFYMTKKTTRKNLYLSSRKPTPESSDYDYYYESVYKRIGR